MKHYIIGLITLGILSLALTAPSYADRITHLPSGKCVHPEGRSINPGNNTRLVLHGDDCARPDVFLEFTLQQDGQLIHTASRKCVQPRHPKNWGVIDNNTELVLVDSCLTARFALLPGGYIRHNKSGKCVHLRTHQSVLTIPDNTRLVLYDGCSGDRLKFSIAPIKSRVVVGKTKLYHVTSGKCVHPYRRPEHPNNNTDLVFHKDDCDVADNRLYFTMLANGAIQHVSSGKCIHPYGGWVEPGNNTALVLYDGCARRSVQFKQRSNGAIEHLSSGKCIHPYKGSQNPRDNTKLVLYDGCYGDKLELNFH